MSGSCGDTSLMFDPPTTFSTEKPPSVGNQHPHSLCVRRRSSGIEHPLLYINPSSSDGRLGPSPLNHHCHYQRWEDYGKFDDGSFDERPSNFHQNSLYTLQDYLCDINGKEALLPLFDTSEVIRQQQQQQHQQRQQLDMLRVPNVHQVRVDFPRAAIEPTGHQSSRVDFPRVVIKPTGFQDFQGSEDSPISKTNQISLSARPSSPTLVLSNRPLKPPLRLQDIPTTVISGKANRDGTEKTEKDLSGSFIEKAATSVVVGVPTPTQKKEAPVPSVGSDFSTLSQSTSPSQSSMRLFCNHLLGLGSWGNSSDPTATIVESLTGTASRSTDLSSNKSTLFPDFPATAALNNTTIDAILLEPKNCIMPVNDRAHDAWYDGDCESSGNEDEESSKSDLDASSEEDSPDQLVADTLNLTNFIETKAIHDVARTSKQSSSLLKKKPSTRRAPRGTGLSILRREVTSTPAAWANRSHESVPFLPSSSGGGIRAAHVFADGSQYLPPVLRKWALAGSENTVGPKQQAAGPDGCSGVEKSGSSPDLPTVVHRQDANDAIWPYHPEENIRIPPTSVLETDQRPQGETPQQYQDRLRRRTYTPEAREYARLYSMETLPHTVARFTLRVCGNAGFELEQFKTIIDSGASGSYISEAFFRQLSQHWTTEDVERHNVRRTSICTILGDGSVIDNLIQVDLTLDFSRPSDVHVKSVDAVPSTLGKDYRATFMVLPGLPSQILLGTDILCDTEANLAFSRKPPSCYVRFGAFGFQRDVEVSTGDGPASRYRNVAFLAKKADSSIIDTMDLVADVVTPDQKNEGTLQPCLTIPPYSARYVTVRSQFKGQLQRLRFTSGLITNWEGARNWEIGRCVARGFVDLKDADPSGRCQVLVTNFSCTSIPIVDGELLATFVGLDPNQYEIVDDSSLPPLTPTIPLSSVPILGAIDARGILPSKSTATPPNDENEILFVLNHLNSVEAITPAATDSIGNRDGQRVEVYGSRPLEERLEADQDHSLPVHVPDAPSIDAFPQLPPRPDLCPTQLRTLQALLDESADLFDDTLRPLNISDTLYQYEIPLVPGTQPIACPPHRQNPEKQKAIRDHVAEMTRREIIEPSTSPWAAPVVLANKSDGTLRFCIDYRRLNAVVKKDSYPLPRVDDSLDQLGGNEFFTTLDLASGFWQIPLTQDAKEKTAFITPNGLFQYTRLPFGLVNSPAQFQRMMNAVLAGLQWQCCLVYVDDIIIYSATFDDHIRDLRAVFDRIRAASLRLKGKKCTFAAREVRYLGHVVDAVGIRPDPDKVAALVNMPVPTSVSALRSFLGLANYYRRWIKGFAKYAAPLYRLLKKEVPYVVSPEVLESVQVIKTRLAIDPVLHHPDFTKKFYLQTDACQHGLGVILMQYDADGRERIIACASRNLTSAEEKWSVREYEALAIIWGCELFRHYLIGRQFEVQTDHGSLRWLMENQRPGRLMRWALRLQEFDFVVRYREGNCNQNADGLSRNPVPSSACPSCLTSPCFSSDVVEDRPAVSENSEPDYNSRGLFHITTTVAEEIFDPLRLPLDAFKRSQAASKDKVFANVLRVHALQGLPTALSKADTDLMHRFTVDSAGRVCHRRQFSALVHDPILLEANNTTVLLPVVPSEVVASFIAAAHDMTHPGRRRTIQLLRARYWWPSLTADVCRWIQSCEKCLTFKGSVNKRLGHPQHLRVASAPGHTVAMDIMQFTPAPDEVGEGSAKCVLVMIDTFTRWPELIPMPDKGASSVVNAFLQWVTRHGVPVQLNSDMDSAFMGKVMKRAMARLKVTQHGTTPYHHQSNGIVERAIRFFKTALSTLVRRDQQDWVTQLQFVAMAYRMQIVDGMDTSPFYLMHGRQPRLPLDILAGTETTLHDDYERYGLTFTSQLKQAFQTVNDQRRALQAQSDAKASARKVHPSSQQPTAAKYYQDVALTPGDTVYIHRGRVSSSNKKAVPHSTTDPILHRKLLPQFKGPATVVQPAHSPGVGSAPVSFFVSTPTTSNNVPPKIVKVHVSQLKPSLSRSLNPVAGDIAQKKGGIVAAVLPAAAVAVPPPLFPLPPLISGDKTTVRPFPLHCGDMVIFRMSSTDRDRYNNGAVDETKWYVGRLGLPHADGGDLTAQYFSHARLGKKKDADLRGIPWLPLWENTQNDREVLKNIVVPAGQTLETVLDVKRLRPRETWFVGEILAPPFQLTPAGFIPSDTWKCLSDNPHCRWNQ